MDIFDLKDISDIPKGSGLELMKKIKTPDRIVELLTIANRPLHVDELVVAHFRKYGILKNKTKISTLVAKMAKEHKYNVKKSPRKGVYELDNKGDK